MRYEVYTYFGRVVATYPTDRDRLNVRELVAAQKECARLDRTTGNEHWVRLID